MSDFANRLLGRLDAAPVRPLLLSRFEPATPLARDEPLPPFVDVSSPQPAEAIRPEPVLLPESPVQAGDVEPPPASTRPAPPVGPPPKEAIEPVLMTEAPGHRPAPPATTPPPLVTPPPHPAAARRPSRSVAKLRHAPLPLVAPADPSLPPVAPRKHPAEEAGTASRPTVPAASPVLVEASEPLVPKRAHPVSPPVFLARLPPERTVATPEPEPVVHITIGRVEVRATAEPAPESRRSPKRTPALGLDEYLRRKAGGE